MNHQIIKIERQILQALCQGVNGAPLAEEVWRQLDDYHWLEFEHQTIFTALSSLRLLPPAMIRDRLSQRLTRMGFPDLVLDDLFKPCGCSGAEIEAAINRLAAGK